MIPTSIRPLLEEDDAKEFDRLIRIQVDSDQQDFLEALRRQLDQGRSVSAYAAFIAARSNFNLTALRTLQRGLQDLGLPDMALEVIEEIAERSGAPADHRALRKAEVDAIIREVDRYTPRRERRDDPSLFAVSDDDLQSWGNWIREHSSDRIGEWFYTSGQSASAVMEDGWVFEEFEPVPVSPRSDWVESAIRDRTWGFTLHSWEFLDPVMRQYFNEGDRTLLQWAVEVGASWSEQALSRDTSHTMMWYDMALALRSPRLAGLLHAAVAADFKLESLEPLFRLALAHADAHEASESFVARNNHGFYAALGQIVLTRDLRCMTGMWRGRVQGEARMKLMAEQQFLPDGGHVEHSPDYHRMLLTSFQKAIGQGVITSPKVIQRIERASEALGWFVQPNGRILQFGDSPGRPMIRGKSEALSKYTQFITTAGKRGQPHTKELFVLPATGYAVVRTPQPQVAGEHQGSSYLAFTAGFHSRAHKHCDDLSLVWTHKGEEILVDGGRYGYGPQLPKNSPLRDEGFFYVAPERQYVESVRAHNTVSVDHQEHNRRRRPYGSGLVSAEQSKEGFTLVGQVPHEGWSHRREILLESDCLTITDEVTLVDDGEHEYALHFLLDEHLGVAWEDRDTLSLERAEGRRIIVSWDDEGSELHVV